MTDRRETLRPPSTAKGGNDQGLAHAGRLASEARDRWRRGEQPDVGAVIAQHPEVKRYRSVVLDLAYEEYCWRRKAGEDLDPEAFSQRFPTFHRSLCLLLQVHSLFDRDPGFRTLDDLAAWPQPGDSFLGFQLVAELGRGTFGRVFLAREPALGNREVAVKVALQGGQEAKILGRLRHPNIVPVYSVQEDAATCLTAFCMPYLGRATLCDVLDRAFSDSRLPMRASTILDTIRAVNDDVDSADALPPDRILRTGTYVEGVVHLGVQLAEALVHAHSRGVYHRDLKPSNVLLSLDGRPLLLDFNLSVDSDLPARRIGGTLPYMAPEQLAMVAEKSEAGRAWHYDPRSDLFSLGVILYELLADGLPFGDVPSGRTVEELAAELRQRQALGPQPLEVLDGGAERGVARAIEACLAFDPEHRPQTAGELAATLRHEVSPPRRARRWVRQRRRPLAAAGCVLVAVALAVAAALAMRPPYSVRQFQLGRAYAERGDYASAQDCFTTALRSDPHNGEILIARADALCQLGDFRMAFEDYREANRSIPGAALIAKMAYCLSRLGQHLEATGSYRAALNGGYRSPGLLNNIGFAFHQLGQLDESEKYLRQAIQLDGNLGAAHHTLALVSLRRALGGQPVSGEAIALAKKAVALGPPSADLYRDVAALFAVAASRDASLLQPAIQCLEKATL
jgi:serine/threonine protein kinase